MMTVEIVDGEHYKYFSAALMKYSLVLFVYKLSKKVRKRVNFRYFSI